MTRLGRCGSRSLASLRSPLYDNHVRMKKSHHKNGYAERKHATETRCKGKKWETEKEKIRLKNGKDSHKMYDEKPLLILAPSTNYVVIDVRIN